MLEVGAAELPRLVARHSHGRAGSAGPSPCLAPHQGPSLQGQPISASVIAGPLPFTSALLQMLFCLGSVGRRPCYKLGLLFRSSVIAAVVKQSQ